MPLPRQPTFPGPGAGTAACRHGEQQPPALVRSRIHPDEGWERRRCSRSLVLPFWLFPTATPHRSQHPSVTAAFGTPEQEKEFGLVSAVLALHCGLDGCSAYANSSCSAGGKTPPPGTGGRQARGCRHLQHDRGTVNPKASRSSAWRVVLQEGLRRQLVQSGVGVRVTWAPGPTPARQPAWALPAKNAVPLLPAAPGCWHSRSLGGEAAPRLEPVADSGEMFWDFEIGFRGFFGT